jgi:cytochrome P450
VLVNEHGAAGAQGRASIMDTVSTAANLVGPTVAQGVIARRPSVIGVFDRLDADRRAVRQMQQLADRYGPGPVQLAVPGRSFALVLDPEHAHRILAESPEPFATANLEKRAALNHFQPRGVLISHGRERAERRRFNEAVLDTSQPVHQMADSIIAKVRDEAERLAAEVSTSGELAWEQFIAAWWRVVRRVVLGDAARDDHETTDLLTRLRREANWSYLLPRRFSVYDRFKERLRGHLDRAEPGSLAGLMAQTAEDERTAPVDQVPQWLFAFDPAGMVAIRALALLTAHPGPAREVRDEIAGVDLSTPQELRRLRAAVLESVRLWPTTPAILRDSTRETTWPTGTLPAGTGFLIFAPYFHRDDRTLPYADRFEPQVWLDERGHGDWPLIPFSEGPGVCPGQNLVLLTTSTFLAVLLDTHEFRLLGPDRLDADHPMPATLSPYAIRFAASPRTDP